MNVLSLFSGIGGFDLGLERAGMTTVAQCEINPFRQKVLNKHWPDVPVYDDITTLSAQTLGDVQIDVITGGFPCQDLSKSGKGAGLDGVRSGLWFEFSRLIRELRPRFVIVENVPSLLTGRSKRWDHAPIGVILGELSEYGYDAEWCVLSAKEFGAPHLRKRIWLVAYLADTAPFGSERTLLERDPRREPEESFGDCNGGGGVRTASSVAPAGVLHDGGDGGYRETEREACGVDDGVPATLDGDLIWNDPAPVPYAVKVPPEERRSHLSSLGDALIPQIAEWIGRQILSN